MKNTLLQISLYIILLSLFSFHVTAEDNLYTDPRVHITTPSSEAQSLGSFSEIPVDLYTGRTNITIPLLTLSFQDIEVPISLSYHGGGVKVDEEAGIVGLGWTLNVGGMVSRIVRGMPDEAICHGGKAKGYDQLDNETRNFIEMLKKRSTDLSPMDLLNNTNQRDTLRQMMQFGYLYDNNNIDVAPDNYIFYSPKVSGAFVGKNPQNIQSNAGCKLTYQNDAYHLIDLDGYQYIFAQPEKQIYPCRIGHSYLRNEWTDLLVDCYKYTSAWWMSSIVSPTGNSVNFRYIEEKRTPIHSNFYTYTQYTTLNTYGDAISVHNSYNSTEKSYNPNKLDTIYHQLVDLISAPNSQVQFHYSLSDSILPNAHKMLDSISWYALGYNGWNLIERFCFKYAKGANTLKSIIHKGRNGHEQKYTLTYFLNSGTSIGINNRDHWGYFSKESEGRFANKKYLGITPTALLGSSYTERYADNEHASNNMLKSITYPSGLTATFIWEPHQFSKLSHLAKQSPLEYNYDKPLPIYDTIVRHKFELSGKLNQETCTIATYISSNQYIELDLSHYFYSSDVWNIMDCVMNWRQDYSNNDLPRVSIQLNGQEIFSSYLDSMSIRPNTYTENQIHKLVNTYGSGNYTFLLSNPRSTLRNENSDCCIHYHEMFNKPELNLGKIPITIFELIAKENPRNECNVGGVRIKRIEYYQGNKPLLLKEYSYVDSTGNSSGVMAYSPRYASKYPFVSRTTLVSEFDLPDVESVSDLLVLRSNGLPYSLNGGGHIEYEKVTEHMISQAGTNDENYLSPVNQIDYYYATATSESTSDIDETKYEELIPADMLQLTSRKHQRGHLIKKVEYTDEIKTTEYDFQILEKTAVDIITGVLFPIADYQNVTFSYDNIRPYKNYGIVKYRVIPYNKRLMSQKTTGDITNNYHAYTYANTTYSELSNADMPITHTYITSEGDTLIEHMNYLPNTNKIDSCITTKHGFVVNGYKLEYDNAYRIKKKYELRQTSLSLSTIDNIEWDLIETYDYDTIINKVREIYNHQTKTVTTYLWSYWGEYPIAEITNATFNDVQDKAKTLNINQLQYSYNPEISEINHLRELLPDAQIRTMTYLPFIGMSSFTDPKGYTLYYEYDDFKRLTTIYELINGKKNIIKHFDYQLRNQE